MSRLTLALKNVTGYWRVTGYFFEKCHGLVEKCHGKKKLLAQGVNPAGFFDPYYAGVK